MMVPDWAWGLMVAVLLGGFGTIGGMLAYYIRRVDGRLDGHDKMLGNHDHRLTRIEARQPVRNGRWEEA